MNSKKKQAWLVDLDGTLYKPTGVKLAMAAELALFGAHRVAILRAFRKSHEALREELRLDPRVQFLPNPFEEQVRRTAAATKSDEDHVRSVVLDWMVVRPGKWLSKFKRKEIVSRIEVFRAQGGKTALVSDYPARSKLAALGVGGLFDAVVASGEHPRLTRLKPCPDGYLLAAEKLGVEAGECLVLGDREDADGAAAKAAGMEFELVS
jgi:FMN phosphatase YigB (HAD superfamily)